VVCVLLNRSVCVSAEEHLLLAVGVEEVVEVVVDVLLNLQAKRALS
jgi:hypothetical protein